MNLDVRWRQRLQNLSRALSLLSDGLESGSASLSTLEQEGIVQRFEYTFELAWKTVRDYLEASGATISPVTPVQVLRDALAAKVITNGHVWMDMLSHRNLLSHTYQEEVFHKAVEDIERRYLPEMAALHTWLTQRADD